MELKFSPTAMRRIREDRGLSQQTLGDLYGNRSSVNAYERGRVIPGLATVNRLAKLLDCSPFDLLTEDDES